MTTPIRRDKEKPEVPSDRGLCLVWSGRVAVAWKEPEAAAGGGAGGPRGAVGGYLGMPGTRYRSQVFPFECNYWTWWLVVAVSRWRVQRNCTEIMNNLQEPGVSVPSRSSRIHAKSSSQPICSARPGPGSDLITSLRPVRVTSSSILPLPLSSMCQSSRLLLAGKDITSSGWGWPGVSEHVLSLGQGLRECAKDEVDSSPQVHEDLDQWALETSVERESVWKVNGASSPDPWENGDESAVMGKGGTGGGGGGLWGGEQGGDFNLRQTSLWRH